MIPKWAPQALMCGLLLWALNPENPYAYYVLLRWICCPTFAYLAVEAFGSRKREWGWILGVLAAVYNPLVPVHLTREIWAVVNVATIVITIGSIVAFRRDVRVSATSE